MAFAIRATSDSKPILDIAQVDISKPIGTGRHRLPRRASPQRRRTHGRRQDVINLFSTRDPAEARTLAQKLNELNGDRQAEEASILEKIHATLASESGGARCLLHRR